jgi:hypothetical protein
VPERVKQMRPLVFGVVVLTSYATVGLGGGWMWHELWQPSSGVVVDHQWYPDGEALRQDFSGTALYVLVALGLGVAMGVVFAIVGSSRPVFTLVSCVAGAALAGWLMLWAGERLGPADPAELALRADDGTTLPSTLTVSGLPPLFAFAVGTLAALGAIFTLFSDKTPEATFDGEPRG